MSAQNYPWKNDSGPSSTAPQYKFLLSELEKGKEKLEEKNKQIKELEESKRRDNENITNLEKRIVALEGQRDILQEKWLSLQQELDLVKANLKRLSPAEVTEAYLNLGALCDRLQTMMYPQVLPEKFCPGIDNMTNVFV